MQIYRSRIGIAATDIKATLREFLKNFTWHNKDLTEDSDKYYVNQYSYIEVLASGRITLYDTVGNWNTSISTTTGSNYVQVFAADTQCGGLEVSTSNAYKLTNSLCWDTVTGINGEKSGAFCATGSSSTYYLSDGLSPTKEAAKFYSSSNISETFPRTQMIPFVNSSSGAKFDNIKIIIMSSINNNFAQVNNNKWLISSGFVFPCGDKIEYLYV